MSREPIGLYVHIPFCARRCDYCDFFVVVGDREEDDFFAWLDRDLEISTQRLGAAPVFDTIYLGGGTPSHVDPAAIDRLIGRVRELAPLAPRPEITLEANPESVTPERAERWIVAGINRLSLGVQSFDDAVLPRRGRQYDAEGACRAAHVARQAGFDNLGIDLIAGLPGETRDGFVSGIDRLTQLGPDHVSVYLLETGESLKDTPLARAVSGGRERLPDDDTMAWMYRTAVRRLEAAGYRHYEISNFARPGLESRHNMKYWLSREYLGVGPSAHSHVGGLRYSRPAGMAAWFDQVGRGIGRPEGSDYTLADPQARAREALVQALRLIDGVDLESFARDWELDPSPALDVAIDQMVDDGLLQRRSGRLALTPRGILLSNEVFLRLM